MLDILLVLVEIQAHSRPVIEHCYREFLLHDHDPEEREYPEASYQSRKALIHGTTYRKRTSRSASASTRRVLAKERRPSQ